MRKPFIPFMKFAFKVVYLDEKYEYMAVGYPKNTMGWIMGREPSVSESKYDEIINELKKVGYSRDQFEFVKHN